MKTFLRLPEVMARTGLARATIYRNISNNDFPPPIKLGKRTSVWLEDEIDEWINAQVTRSNSGSE